MRTNKLLILSLLFNICSCSKDSSIINACHIPVLEINFDMANYSSSAKLDIVNFEGERKGEEALHQLLGMPLANVDVVFGCLKYIMINHILSNITEPFMKGAYNLMIALQKSNNDLILSGCVK